MHLSKLLYYEGCTKLTFDPRSLKGLEVWVLEVSVPQSLNALAYLLL
jgi:hypothetical protein